MIPFENENIEAYRLFMRIEIAIRELIAEYFLNQYGDKWRKKIPGDLLEKIRNSEKEECHPQFEFLHLGPLYYLTLGELISLLNKKDGRMAVNAVGGTAFIEQLKNILAVRNAVAHCRSVSASGLLAIRALYHQMETALTNHRMVELLSKPDVGIRPQDVIPYLIEWLEKGYQLIENLDALITSDEHYQMATNQYWWGDQAMSGFDCDIIEKVASMFYSYMEIPQGLGTAAERHHIVVTNNMLCLIHRALESLREAQK